MKKIYTLIIAIFTFISLPLSAESIDSIFAKLPVKELSLLSFDNRLDLLDYANCGQSAKVENLCFGTTALTQKTDDYLCLEMTSVNRVELFLLSRNQGDTIVGMLSTISSPFEESKIRFYSLVGEVIELDFQIPSPAEMVDSTQTHLLKSSWIPLLPIRINYDSEAKLFEFAASTNFIPLEEKKNLTDLLKTIRYRWDGNSFVQE